MNIPIKNHSARSARIVLSLTGLILSVIYGFLSIESNAVYEVDILDFLGPYWLAAATILIFWFYLGERKVQIPLLDVIVWAVIFRLIGIAGSPILEDDLYRYLLHGCDLSSLNTGFGIGSPGLFGVDSPAAECLVEFSWINNPDLPTLYGPLLQYLLALTHFISPADSTLLQVIVSIFDLGLILLLARFAPARMVLLYAWCPLAIKEIAFTAHPDIIGIFLLFAAFTARSRQKDITAAALVALACSTKIFAFLALPFFLYKKSPKIQLTVCTILAAVYLPALLQGQTGMLIAGIMAERWTFNPILFDAATKILPDLAARYLCLGLFIVWWVWYIIRYYRNDDHPEPIPRMDWIFGVFFVLSPVINPWYVLWLLPFAVLKPALWSWTAALVVSLSYVTGLNLVESSLMAHEIDPYARTLEIGLISLALVVDYRKGRF